jgi:hypothetical protein
VERFTQGISDQLKESCGNFVVFHEQKRRHQKHVGCQERTLNVSAAGIRDLERKAAGLPAKFFCNGYTRGNHSRSSIQVCVWAHAS